MTNTTGTPERLKWLEGFNPHLALARMHESGELRELLPEVDCLYGVPQNPHHHPEIDTGVHTELVLQVAAALSSSPMIRFAAMTHDLGKGLTPSVDWPRHIDHETLGEPPVHAVCTRLAVNDDWRQLAVMVCVHHLRAHRALDASPRAFIRLFEESGLAHAEHLEEPFLLCVEADMRGRAGWQDFTYRQGRLLRKVFSLLRELPRPMDEAATLKEVERVHRERLARIGPVVQFYKDGGDTLPSDKN